MASKKRDSASFLAEKCFSRGFEFHQAGRHNDAMMAYQEALTHVPLHFDALHMGGVLSFQSGNYRLASDLVRQALSAVPRSVEALTNYAIILQASLQPDEALVVVDRALELAGPTPNILVIKGSILMDLLRFSEAYDQFSKCLKIDPENVKAHSNAVLCAQQSGDHESALQHNSAVLSLLPDDTNVLLQRALLLDAMDQKVAAVECFTRIIGLQSGNADALYRRGVLHAELDRYPQALKDYLAVISLDPSHVKAWVNMGFVLDDLGKTQEALKAYDQALRLSPDLPEALMNKSLIQLAGKQFSEGWDGYTARFFTSQGASKLPETSAPVWDGGYCGHLLVVGEQGVGDQILHGSLLPHLEGMVDHVTVMVDPRLVRAFRRSMPWLCAVPQVAGCRLPPHDAFVPLASLGSFFRQMESEFAGQFGGFLIPDAARAADIAAQLNKKPRIGISWKSASTALSRHKGIALAQLLSVLNADTWDLLNLQFGDTFSDVEGAGVPIETVHGLDLFHDLEGALAAIACCDAVVTISNTTAHLAGGLGVPVFLLLPYAAGKLWYWHTQDNSVRSLWYPSVRVFRQQAPGDWSGALALLRDALECRLSSVRSAVQTEHRGA